MDPLDTIELTRKSHGRHWLDLTVAGSAILIAVISLAVALHQSSIMERQLAASVWPYLQFASSNGDENGNPVIRLEVKNAGVGPARIHGVTLLYDGKAVINPKGLADACCSDLEDEGKPDFSISTVHGTVLTPDQIVHVLTLRDLPANARYWKRLDANREAIQMRACYCSVLDECWVFDSRTLAREPVGHCPAPQQTDYKG